WKCCLFLGKSRGEDGQLGHGDAEDRLIPTHVGALDGLEIVSFTCGADHTTAYSGTQMEVYSWGWGDFGRLGHGNSRVTMESEVQSWGRNQNGQLGLGSNEDSLVPQKIQAFQ
ncbi:hypothetical protein UlMin_044783, partial [Ulmus minor]